MSISDEFLASDDDTDIIDGMDTRHKEAVERGRVIAELVIEHQALTGDGEVLVPVGKSQIDVMPVIRRGFDVAEIIEWAEREAEMES